MERINNNDETMVKLCIEKMYDSKAYPNLATLNATPYTVKWREFSVNAPFSEPVMLLEHLNEHNIDYEIVSLDDANKDTFYPIALSFFDFSIKWFELMSKKLISKLKKKDIKILFYYSEGDNPYIIDKHLKEQCADFNIPNEQIHFISANSEATNIDNFYHVVDDELLFRFRNSKVPAINYTEHKREKKFTALVRMHKFWRANVMATIWQLRLDTDGYFAYGDQITAGDLEEDNPIEVDKYFGLRQRTKTFLSMIPFKADELSSTDHNNHTTTVTDHFSNSYINIILESHMDVDQSGGILLTEKTFKPIKNSQLFVIFGAKGSLQLLRDMGYKTFDHVINNSYDEIENTTERWKSAMDNVITILERSNDEIHKMYLKCKDDIIHNQKLFNASKKTQLTNILKELQND